MLEIGAVKAHYPVARFILAEFSGYGGYHCEAGHFALRSIVLQRLRAGMAVAATDGQFGTPLDGASLAAQPEVFRFSGQPFATSRSHRYWNALKRRH